VDVADNRIDFVMKHHVIHGPEENYFPNRFYRTLTEEQKVQKLWWDGSFEYGERIMMSGEELDPYLATFVAANRPPKPLRDRISKNLRRVANRIR
jgi:hypothetical protein